MVRLLRLWMRGLRVRGLLLQRSGVSATSLSDIVVRVQNEWATLCQCSEYITCTAGGAVTRLDFYNEHLGGTVPPFLASLSVLESIDFRLNQLTGTLPPYLWTLTDLTDISVSSNDSTGTLPASFGLRACLHCRKCTPARVGEQFGGFTGHSHTDSTLVATFVDGAWTFVDEAGYEPGCAEQSCSLLQGAASFAVLDACSAEVPAGTTCETMCLTGSTQEDGIGRVSCLCGDWNTSTTSCALVGDIYDYFNCEALSSPQVPARGDRYLWWNSWATQHW